MPRNGLDQVCRADPARFFFQHGIVEPRKHHDPNICPDVAGKQRELQPIERTEPNVGHDNLRTEGADFPFGVFESAARNDLKSAVGKKSAQRAEQRQIVVY